MRAVRLLWVALIALGLPHQSLGGDTQDADADRCVQSGGTWDRDHLRPQGHCISDTAGKCAARGGKWMRVCLNQGLKCVASMRDAGKACTDNSQCVGGCLDVGNPPLSDGTVVGACRRDDDPCGTFSYIVNGRRSGAVLNVD